ncbi:hypothetical protein EVAR_71018_1 [Eumeta japonica]|uniref:Uncharacterized protein n=1 Tax=Eumeta variegata TaxID=151549 RepID=A0A4C2AC32_EUMVA|nr:hypothetical protein EVAR_71018_1 [Eumeta japonica]
MNSLHVKSVELYCGQFDLATDRPVRYNNFAHNTDRRQYALDSESDLAFDFDPDIALNLDHGLAPVLNPGPSFTRGGDSKEYSMDRSGVHLNGRDDIAIRVERALIKLDFQSSCLSKLYTSNQSQIAHLYRSLGIGAEVSAAAAGEHAPRITPGVLTYHRQI